jgi:tRNA(Arg) A34 adenosine deaminase TadA
MAAIYWARADRVFYASTARDAARFGFDDHFIYEQLQLPAHGRKLLMTQMMRQEALETFVAWEQNPKKINY